LVVKKRRKRSSHSTFLSPSTTNFCAPSTVKFFSRMGSIIGSSSSSMASNRNGLPNCTASSRCFMKSELFMDLMVRLNFFSRSLIQPTACSCGSTHSGKREERVVRMPFCTECSSDGSPSAPHCCTSASVVSTDSSLNGSVSGMARSRTSVRKWSKIISDRNVKVKAPT